MKVTINALKQLINEEFKKSRLRESKEEDRKDIPDMEQERRFAVAEALDVLEQAAEDATDSEEVRWWLTKVGEAFGLEPEEEK
jgi:hypothetical protein